MDINFISPFPREPLHQQMVLKPGHTPAHEPREGRVVPRHGGLGGGGTEGNGFLIISLSSTMLQQKILPWKHQDNLIDLSDGY